MYEMSKNTLVMSNKFANKSIKVHIYLVVTEKILTFAAS